MAFHCFCREMFHYMYHTVLLFLRSCFIFYFFYLNRSFFWNTVCCFLCFFFFFAFFFFLFNSTQGTERLAPERSSLMWVRVIHSGFPKRRSSNPNPCWFGLGFQAIWHLERVILQVDTCRPHGGNSNQYYQLKDHQSELKKKKIKRNNCILSVAISNIPIRLSIPPLDRQIAVITQKPCGGPLQAKTLITLLPAISSVSVIWQGSVYLVTLLPKWTLAISLCLGKTKLWNFKCQSFAATYQTSS